MWIKLQANRAEHGPKVRTEAAAQAKLTLQSAICVIAWTATVWSIPTAEGGRSEREEMQRGL